MGAAASVEIIERTPEELTETEKYCTAFNNEDSVDIFVKEMFMSSPKIDALQHVLSNETGRTAFMKFLRTEYAEENLGFFMAVDAFRKANNQEDLAKQANSIVDTYLKSGLATEVNVSEALRDTITSMVANEGQASMKELMSAFEAAQNETIKIMAMGAFPRFVMSDAFIQYRQLDHVADEEVRKKTSTELDKLLNNTSWLSHLLSSVENLPVCVSLAAASKQLTGFPLIYVNGAFEKTTGYSRDDIIGQNGCRFLQMGRVAGHTSEDESISKMTIALREGKRVKVAITNYKKDGTPFRNLLAMKPIFDDEGKYAFVLGIQFDIGDGDASAKKMKIIDDLFKVLPDRIMGTPEGDMLKNPPPAIVEVKEV